MTAEERLRSLPIYKHFKGKFDGNPQTVWILTQLVSQGPLTSKDLWKNYENDPSAIEQKLFPSDLIRQKHHETALVAPTFAGKEHLLCPL